MDPYDMPFGYVNRFRSFLLSGAWQGLARDLARNDVPTLLHLHHVRPSRMSNLTVCLSASLSTATGVVSRLQQRDLVERQRNPDDKRIMLISLTEEGSRLITQGIKDSVLLIGRLSEKLIPEETAVVLRVTDRIPGLLTEHPVKRKPRAIRRILIDRTPPPAGQNHVNQFSFRMTPQ